MTWHIDGDAIYEPGSEPGDIVCVRPEMGDALSEIRFLRECLRGAIVGDRIIRDQLACSEDKLLQWVVKQAAHNISCHEESLRISREDFPWAETALSRATAQNVGEG